MTVQAAPDSRVPSRFIIGPVADRLCLIYAPLIAFLLAVLLQPATSIRFRWGALYRTNAVMAFIAMFGAAHLVIVFFRSHGNRQIFSLYPGRFVVAPLVLFGLLMLSVEAAVIVFIIGIWWDVYHSAMQTFGIGRIYDRKAGNDAHMGRELDRWLNLLLYIGPIISGATLIHHVNLPVVDQWTGSMFFEAVPAHVDAYQKYVLWATVGVGLPFLTYYVYRYWRLAQQGYKVSSEKVALLVSTGVCSIYVWGWNSFGMAFFIMNFFHALQYFALIWTSEKRSMRSLLGLDGFRLGSAGTFVLFLAVAFGYGFAVTVSSRSREPGDAVFATVMVVSIMHFWYDGFIWSVRKKQI